VVARKRRLHPDLAWPVTATELALALGIDASNYGADHTTWRSWMKEASATPLSVKWDGPKTADLFNGAKVTVEPVARADRQRVHDALLQGPLAEMAAWISSLPARPPTYLAAGPSLSWQWNGYSLVRQRG
jgi:hypothetical protein